MEHVGNQRGLPGQNRIKGGYNTLPILEVCMNILVIFKLEVLGVDSPTFMGTLTGLRYKRDTMECYAYISLGNKYMKISKVMNEIEYEKTLQVVYQSFADGMRWRNLGTGWSEE